MKLWQRRRTAGVSLVEILVALAVLVIGVLAVLRIFPRGLGTLSQVSDRQEAVRLAEATSNRLQAVADRLPDFILPAGQPTDIIDTSASFGFLRLNANSADHRPYDFDLPYTDPNDPGLLHRLLADDRLVVGERVLVGRRVGDDGSGNVTTAARPYHTLFGPLAPQVQRDALGQPILDGNGNEQPLLDGNSNQLAELAALRLFRQVSVLELRRTIVTGATGQSYRDRPVFAVVDGGRDDFTGAPAADKLLFELDSTARLFVVRCAYHDSYGNIVWVQLAPLTVPAVAVPSPTSYYEVPLTLPQPPFLAITDVVPESVQVKQVLNRDAATTGALNRFDFRDQGFQRGVLFFSPALAGENLSLEYVVEDWRNLSEEVDLTTDAAGAITAPVNLQLQLAARNLDETFVPRVVVVATGQSLPVDSAAWAADPAMARGGIIPLLAGSTLDPVAGSRAVRVFYRKFGNWAVAPDIGPSSYIMTQDAAGLTSSGNTVDYPVQNLLVDVQPGPVVGADSYTELWFRPSEAGQTVTVAYEVNGLNGRELISGEVHVIPTQSNRTNSGDGSSRHGIVLDRPNVAVDTQALPRPLIHTIAGRSLQIRVAYDEDVPGILTSPVITTPVPGVEYLTAERLVELSTYVRRGR